MVHLIAVFLALTFPYMSPKAQIIGATAQLVSLTTEPVPMLVEAVAMPAEPVLMPAEPNLMPAEPVSGKTSSEGQTNILSFQNKILIDRNQEIDPQVKPKTVYVPAQIDVEQKNVKKEMRAGVWSDESESDANRLDAKSNDSNNTSTTSTEKPAITTSKRADNSTKSVGFNKWILAAILSLSILWNSVNKRIIL